MSTVLLLIATGEKYWRYIQPLLDSADRFFVPHDTLLLTDCPNRFKATQFYQANAGFPETTLKRYHSFLNHKSDIESFDYAFYVDVDALFVSPVGSEIFSNGITATLHLNQNPYDHLEERPESEAYLKTIQQYFCGGFNGGASAAYLSMAEAIRDSVDRDEYKGITARWHDESHLNKYLVGRPPAKILTSDYCFPEPELDAYAGSPKIVCLEKSWSSRHPRLRSV